MPNHHNKNHKIGTHGRQTEDHQQEESRKYAPLEWRVVKTIKNKEIEARVTSAKLDNGNNAYSFTIERITARGTTRYFKQADAAVLIEILGQIETFFKDGDKPSVKLGNTVLQPNL